MTTQFTPDYCIHPGEYLEEVLETRNIKKTDFAKRCGISAKAVSQILNCKSLYSTDMAIQFGRVLHINDTLLINMVTEYQMFLSKKKEVKKLEHYKEWIKKFPVKELAKKKIIPESQDIAENTKNILSFFNVSTPEVWDEYYSKKAVCFRKSPTYKSSTESTATWLRIAENEATKIQCVEFNKNVFKDNLRKIQELTLLDKESFIPKMIALCRKSGVALVFVPELADTHISGITEWTSSNNALIAMSLRYKTNDHFWFTFFHEAAHVLLHGKKETFLDSKDENFSKFEDEANNFAKKILVDPVKYAKFITEENFSKEKILEFANLQGIAPGIVVGMLQHDKCIEFSWHNDLKVKMEF